MVILCFFRDDPESIEKLLHATASEFPEIRSLMYVINPKGNDTIQDLEVKCYSGGDHLVEYMEGLKLEYLRNRFFRPTPGRPISCTGLYEICSLTGSDRI
jgi:23S rRNA (uracil1939-C5)-methyltransferase